MDWLAVAATVIMLISITGFTSSVLLSSDMAIIQILGIPKQNLPLVPWLCGVTIYLITICIILFEQWGKERNKC